jgi:hypothetical protein
MWPDLAVAGDMVAAAVRDDDAVLEALRESPDVDWWKVSLTLAFLLRDIRAGKREAMELLDELVSDGA